MSKYLGLRIHVLGREENVIKSNHLGQELQLFLKDE